MSKFRVDLISAEVIEGQGIIEKDLEVRIQVMEGNHSAVWPSFTGYEKLNKGGGAKVFNKMVATYEVASGTLTKQFDLVVAEDDRGEFTLGQNDFGNGTVTFALTPTMTPVTKYATISLNRENMKELGKVKVGLKAYPV